MPLRKWPGGGWTPAKFSTPSALAIYVFSRPRGRLSPWSRFLDISCFFRKKNAQNPVFYLKIRKKFLCRGNPNEEDTSSRTSLFRGQDDSLLFSITRTPSNVKYQKKTFIGSDVCRERIWGASGTNRLGLNNSELASGVAYVLGHAWSLTSTQYWLCDNSGVMTHVPTVIRPSKQSII